MSETAILSHLPPLGGHVHNEVGHELQATLIDLLDLALASKQLHWSVIGTEFRPVHLQLDELVDAWHDMADTVAERAVSIGYWPDGQATAIVAGRESDDVARGPLEDHLVVRELAHRIAATSERIRSRMDRLGDLDLVSQDVLVGVVRGMEKQQWMVRSQLSVGTP
jgi:starvation-inducible DNA-binding protein